MGALQGMKDYQGGHAGLIKYVPDPIPIDREYLAGKVMIAIQKRYQKGKKSP